jgi:cell division protein ZapD
MSVALYEFPLYEKVRNYLRLEQLFAQLEEAKDAQSEYQFLRFLELLFDIMDMVERLDLRTDFLRDIDAHEKKLVHWSQHPDIDNQALDQALQTLHRLSSEIKRNPKLGASLREEKFLSNIRQRFTTPGGVTSFDLPSLFCWLKQDNEIKLAHMQDWKQQLSLIENSLQMLLSFLREKARFQNIECKNGYYQGSVEEKIELVRIQCDSSSGIYPVVSGTRNRFGLKFMRLNPPAGSSGAITEQVNFKLACC